MLLPFKSQNPPDSRPYGSIALIIINVVIFAFTSNGLVAHEDVIKAYGLSGNNNGLINWIACDFLHGDLLHLLGNMWFLYLFGFAVEGRLRTAKMLAVYFGAGWTGSLLHYFLVAVGEPDIPTIGASGAIMGLLGASLFMFPFARMKFLFGLGFFFWRIFEWPMWGVALYYLGFDLFFALIAAESGTAHLAHLGGALGGFVVCLAFRPRRDSAEASEAKAMASDVGDFGILSSRDLASIAGSNPDDPFIALHWMYKSQRDPYGVKPECLASFQRLLPRMLREIEDPASVGGCLTGLGQNLETIPLALIIDCAGRLERHGNYMLALQLYDHVIKSPRARPDDVESAMMRSAILCETALQNHARALGTYHEIVRRFGVSPTADQARQKAKALEARGFSVNPVRD